MNCGTQDGGWIPGLFCFYEDVNISWATKLFEEILYSNQAFGCPKWIKVYNWACDLKCRISTYVFTKQVVVFFVVWSTAFKKVDSKCGITLWPIVPTILQGGFLKTLEEQCKSFSTSLCHVVLCKLRSTCKHSSIIMIGWSSSRHELESIMQVYKDSVGVEMRLKWLMKKLLLRVQYFLCNQWVIIHIYIYMYKCIF